MLSMRSMAFCGGLALFGARQQWSYAARRSRQTGILHNRLTNFDIFILGFRIAVTLSSNEGNLANGKALAIATTTTPNEE